jgi:hypothetical protein
MEATPPNPKWKEFISPSLSAVKGCKIFPPTALQGQLCVARACVGNFNLSVGVLAKPRKSLSLLAALTQMRK